MRTLNKLTEVQEGHIKDSLNIIVVLQYGLIYTVHNKFVFLEVKTWLPVVLVVEGIK